MSKGNVVELRSQSTVGYSGGVDGSGGGPHDGDMEARVRDLEKAFGDSREKLARVEALLSNAATKSDVADIKALFADLKADSAVMESRLIRWFVGTAIAISGVVGALAFGVGRLLRLIGL